MRNILTFLAALFISYGSFALDPITGTLGACVGSTSTLEDSSYSGTWSSSNTLVATVTGTFYGMVTGVSAGTTVITFTSGGSYVTAVFVVSPAPSIITGPTHFCAGSTATMYDTISGGTWSSLVETVAIIGSSDGVAEGEMPGNVQFIYTMGPGCRVVTTPDTVFGVTVTGVTGDSAVCVGSTITLTEHSTVYDYSSTGTWTSSNTAVATVASGGIVTGVAAGTATIVYTLTGLPCGSASASEVVTVVTALTAGTISGPTTVATTSTIALSETISGGSWSSSNTAVATVDGGGNVTGIATGTATITYTVEGYPLKKCG